MNFNNIFEILVKYKNHNINRREKLQIPKKQAVENDLKLLSWSLEFVWQSNDKTKKSSKL